ncbi:hypothetical protein LAD77_01065 [Klebsiella pneumoniae]|nr:hypothetical protein [Klebsiella pneumoniae]
MPARLLAKAILLAGLQIVPSSTAFGKPQVNQTNGLGGRWRSVTMGATETKGLDGVGSGHPLPWRRVTAGGMSSITLASSTAISGIRFGVDKSLLHLPLAIEITRCWSSPPLRAAVVLLATSGTPSVFHLADAGVGGGGPGLAVEDFYRFWRIIGYAAKGDQVIAAGRLVRPP